MCIKINKKGQEISSIIYISENWSGGLLGLCRINHNLNFLCTISRPTTCINQMFTVQLLGQQYVQPNVHNVRLNNRDAYGG